MMIRALCGASALALALGLTPVLAQSDAGTAQALADDAAPKDADADAPQPEPQVAADGEATREGTRNCVDILSEIEGDYSRRAEEAQAALLTMAAADPLVLRMADGSAVDLRPADAEAGPTENWFGDPPRRTAVSSAIDQMRAFSDAGSEEECLAAANAITASLSEWDGIEPVRDMPDAEATAGDAPVAGTPVEDAAAGTQVMQPDAAQGDDAQGGDTRTVSADPAIGTDNASQAVTDGTSVTAADGETVLLSEDEAAEVTATADDTGEGDDYGAPAATEQADVTSADTLGVETTAETNPAMGTGVEGDGAETAALTGDADDRTQEGAGAETPLAPLTTSDEQNDTGTVGEATIPVATDTAETAAGETEAPSGGTRMVERPGRLIIEDAEGREIDPGRTGVQFRTVPID